MLSNVHGSKAYAIYHKVQTVRHKLSSSPGGYSRKVVKKLLSDPAYLFRKLNKNSSNATILIDPKEQYKEWILRNEPLKKDLLEQQSLSKEFKYRPIISIITPVFNPPKKVLVELIESVLNQSYPFWELCLGEFGQNKKTQKLILEYAKKDKRIKYNFFTENKGIAENSNNCLEIANGEYIALLDHDDTLSPDALYENALKLNEKKYDFIYSDKDKINEDGDRFDPLFKPEWSPHLMYSANYLTHLNVMNKKLVEKVGKWDPSTDGAQDWDLFFKVTENTDKIAHIPKILYHWRVSDTSTAMSIETKPYALQGQINSLDFHLNRVGKKGSAYHTKDLMLAVRWDIEKITKNLVLILMNVSDNLDDIKQNLYFFPDSTSFKFIITNRDKSTETKNKDVFYVEEKDKSNLVKKLVQKSSAENLFIIDSSCEKFSVNMYEEMIGWVNQPEVGYVAPLGLTSRKNLVGSMSVFGLGGISGRVFKGAGIEVSDGMFGSPHWYRDVTMLSPDMLCIKRSRFLKFFIDTTNNLDDNLRLSMIELSKEKYNILDTQAIVTINVPKQDLPPNNMQVSAYQKYKKLCSEGDPYYNKNLSLEYLSPHMDLSDGDVGRLPITSKKMLSNYFTKGTQIVASTEKLNDIKFIEKYDYSGKKVIQHPTKEIKTVQWFLSGFDAVYAGLNNIFTFASHLADNNIENIFYIDTQGDVEKETKLIQSYSNLSGAKIEKYYEDNKLPDCDLAIATLWTTAYYVAKHSSAKKKAYFIQDDETLFYKPGSVSALVEASYQLGLIGIANTSGLKIMYEKKYSGNALLLRSSLNLDNYTNTRLNALPSIPYQVFFYGRPAHNRNGFDLGVAALKKLKQKLGEDVNIISAGADWEPSEYGLSGVITNLGKIPMNKLPDFYSSLDAALFLMFSKHPGVVPSELMVSGCPVVVNKSSDETWKELYKNGLTAVVCLPTVTSLCEGLLQVLTTQKLRNKIIPAAREEAVNYYSLYAEECQQAIKSINKL